MKRVYWRPNRVSHRSLVLIAVISLTGLGVVEAFPERTGQDHSEAMIEASSLARRAMDVLKQERLRRGLEIDEASDPTGSGLIGEAVSEVTSNAGVLSAKQTTINPNWAAVVVHLLVEAGVEKGDTVAVGASGSFPAINIAIYSAMETLHVEPIVISSASASQWGANHPRLLWLDMERLLHDRNVFGVRSVAASLGGAEDRALGISDEGVAMLKRAIRAGRLPFIDPDSYAESVVERMKLYRRHADGEPIAAYINVGGGTVSVGTKHSKYEFRPGLNVRPAPSAMEIDSVMARFLGTGVPVLHFVQIEDLAARYGLPIQPREMPRVGTGDVFLQRRYSRWLASGALGSILASLFLFIRSGRGQMIFHGDAAQSRRSFVEPSV